MGRLVYPPSMTERSEVIAFRLRVRDEGSVEHGRATSRKYRIHGRAWIEDDTFVIEWGGECEISEAGRGVARQVRETIAASRLRISVTDLGELRVRGRLWFTRLEAIESTLGTFAQLPGGQRGYITMWLPPRQRAIASELVSQIELARADRLLSEAEARAALPRERKANLEKQFGKE
jgi:hypothetical protein